MAPSMRAHSIWPKAPAGWVKVALSSHSALGLAAAALIYIVCLSGAAAVFLNEFKRWEQPAVPEMGQVSPEAAQRFAEAIHAAHPKASPLYIYLPAPDLPRLFVATEDHVWTGGPDGALLGEATPHWAEFLERLHIYLHLPGVIGLTVVGLVGAALTGLIISGFLAHPKIFRDAFTLRWAGSRRLSQADLHNRLSVWGAPFHLVVAWTGAIMGLSSVMLFAVAGVLNGGDMAKTAAPIFGAVNPPNAAPAPFPDVAAALRSLQPLAPAVKPSLVALTAPGSRGQTFEINAVMPRRLIYAERYVFDAGGRQTGRLGLSDDGLGKQVYASSYPLHFGSFGGLPVKLAYGLLGVGLCVITASGVTVWLSRRRDRGLPAPRLEAAWAAVVWGTPAALALSAALLLIARLPATAVFWTGLLAAVAASVAIRDAGFWSRTLRAGLAGLLALVAAAHTARFGADAWGAAAAGVNLSLLLIAGLTALSLRKTF